MTYSISLLGNVNKKSELINDSELTIIQNDFLNNCLIPSLKNNSFNFEELNEFYNYSQAKEINIMSGKSQNTISLSQKLKSSSINTISPLASSELLNILNTIIKPKDFNVKIISSDIDCFRNYIKSFSTRYHLDYNSLFINHLPITDPNELEIINRQTSNFKKLYFIVSYAPTQNTPRGLSWSEFYGTTVLTVPMTFNELSNKKNKRIINTLINDLDYQFVHEYYIKRDAIQAIGTGGISFLIDSVQKLMNQFLEINITKLDQTLTPEELALINTYQAQFALSSYRAAVFEATKGLRPYPIDRSCEDIIKSFDLSSFNITSETRLLQQIQIDSWFAFNSHPKDPETFEVTLSPNTNNLFMTSLLAKNFISHYYNNEIKPNFEVLDQNKTLCKLLKTPIMQEGPTMPKSTRGPRCVGCTAD